MSSLEEVILPRKEVIQPHLPVRLPCYDFTPLTNHTFGASLLRLHGGGLQPPIRTGTGFGDSLLLAQWQPIVPAIVARVQPRT